MKKNYTIIIHKAEQVKGHDIPKYWATCLEIPGANTVGNTIEEIKENIKEAIELMLENNDIILESVALEVANG